MKPPAIAQSIALRSPHHSYRHAAIVLRGGRYVATGYNHDTQHAEVVALRALWPSKRIGTRVWSLRFTKSGRLAMAKPCEECEAYMREADVRAVYYSTSSGEIRSLKL